MKKIYLFAAMAALLASCSSDNLPQEQTAVKQNAEPGAVMFDAYVNRATTRAGKPGTLTTEVLKNSNGTLTESNGFGVFGYYTNDELYSQNSKPEFFYNQKVYYSSGWTYSPIKYWPNEFGSDAVSQAEDKLTFFAYAPYVPVNINTGIAQLSDPAIGNEDLETGIISLSRNTALGDPYVKYYASFDPNKCVDLCFGVAKEEFKSSVDGNYNNVDQGMPYINVKKPKLSDRIYFDFKHALAQLNVQIDADVDEMSHGSKPLDSNTKIYVREVTFEGITDKGMLNLNSEATTVDYKPKWVDLSGINEIKSGKVTIYDGRRNGREGQVNANASNEKPANLNPAIIQNSTETDGVIGTGLQNLFNGASADKPILVIPTEEPLSITIVYDVETEDNNLASFLSDGKTHGSSIENKITKSIKLGTEDLKLAAGKSYLVKLHLGMTSVKFEASVTDWQNPAEETNTDLPVNAPSYSVALGSDASATVPYSGTTGIFQVTGLSINSVAASFETGSGIDVTGTPDGTNPNNVTAEMGGTANFGYTINANNKPKNITGSFQVTQGSSTSKLNITQLACPLGLEATGIGDNGDGKCVIINLKAATATGTKGENWTSATITVTRDRDGVKKNFTQGSGAGLFAVASSSNNNEAQLTLDAADKMEPGDVYTITVAAGDANPETVTFTVGGIKFPAPVSIEYGHTQTLVPQYYGSAPTSGGYTTTPSNANVSVVEGSQAQIKAAKVGSSEITVTATQADTDGYLFSAATKTAICNVTVTPAIATIDFIREDGKDTNNADYNTVITAGETVGVFVATLKNSQGDKLDAGAAAGGKVTYSIVSVRKDGDNIPVTTFNITTTPGTLMHSDALENSKKYVITLQASVEANVNASYSNGTTTTIVEFTTSNP